MVIAKFKTFISSSIGLALLTIFSSGLIAQDYYVYVAAESDDEVSLIHFNAQSQTAEIVHTTEVGVFPAENEGPHGLTVSPDGKYWFVSIAHGIPYGQLWKYETETNKLAGKTELGLFPASMEISPITGLLYVVNFNLHGDMIPSTVSVVEPESMTRLADIDTGIMPHGSRISTDGRKQYHVSMMTDELIEINTITMEISNRYDLVNESLNESPPTMKMDHSGMEHTSMGNKMHMDMPSPKIKPTWADPHPDKALVYVAGNGSDEVHEIDTRSWKTTRRFKTGKAPYNLEVTNDGKLLVVTYKGEAAAGIWDLNTGKEVARIKMSRKIAHGVATTPDSKYAFISVEGVGGEPGSVEIIDLKKLKKVAIVEIGKQAGGIAFWKLLPAS